VDARAVIDRYYDLLAARDRDGLISLFAPDFAVVYHAQDGEFPWSGTFDGIDGFDSFLAAIGTNLDVVQVDRTAITADDERVVVQCVGHWRVKANGADVRGGMVNVFTVADNRISKYEVYADTSAFRRGLDA
jgi:ketosteroid isomerase-like protein